MRGAPVFAVSCALSAGLSLGCGSEKSSGPAGPPAPSGPPVVTSVNGAAAPAGPVGSVVVISGSNFGASQAGAAGQVLFYPGSSTAPPLSSTPVPATITLASDWSDTLIVTSVPAGAANRVLVVQTSGGASTMVTFYVTAAATFSPSGLSWTAGPALPVGLSGHAVAFTWSVANPYIPQYAGTIYVVGGADSTNVPKSSVYYSTVAYSGGLLVPWAAAAPLPQPLAFATTAMASPYNSTAAYGYLYVIGGDSTADGKPVATVYVGKTSQVSGVANWTTTSPLPVPLHSAGAAVFNGSLYVVGGSTVGNVPVATVYRAAISADGSLGAWRTLSPLPFKRSYFGFGIAGTFLYALGGDSGTVAPNDSSLSPTTINDVVYAQIDVRTGNLTAAGWQSGSGRLMVAASKLTALPASGAILVTAGLYVGAATGSTEETYATVNASGATGVVASVTGSSTISSSGGGNVFNHAAVGFVDITGAFHELVVGGDDVNAPTKKRKGSWYH
jgi:hypothetical protein